MERERDELLAAQKVTAAKSTPAAMLLGLKGIEPGVCCHPWAEGLFRDFDGRRQVAAYTGLAPTSWQSG